MKNENGIEKSAILKGVTDYKSVDWLTNFHYKYAILLSTNGKIEYQITDARCLTCVEINENRAFILKATSKIDIAIVTADENNNLIKDYGWYVTTTDSTMFTVENNCKYLYLIFRKKNSTAFTSEDEVINSGLIIKEQVLVSVQMPVLKTTGKNLFDVSKHDSLKDNGDYIEILTEFRQSNTVVYKVLPNEQYTLSFEKFGTNETWVALELNGIYCNNDNKNFNKLITSDSNGLITIRIGSNVKEDKGHKICKLQLEKGTTQTPYEPYKSNILTVNEDLTLRSNGDVYDELNLLTGRLTQRIDENNEVLAQEVVKTVDLSATIRPIEGTMHVNTSSQTIPPLLDMSVPVEATTQNLMSFANIDEEE